MQSSLHSSFQLNNAFDVPFLMEMHDNDLSAISAILFTASQQIAEELDRCMILAEKGDCSELKRRVHLVKPLWGYCGLPQMQMKYQLLEYFIANQRRVLTKAAIAEHIWGDEYDQVSNYDFIYTHIKNLRKKIQQTVGKDYIKSVYGIGYKLSDK